MSDTQDEIWARVKAHREREDKLKAHPLGALFVAYERARMVADRLDTRIEALECPSAKLLHEGREAVERQKNARDAFVDELLK